MNTIEKNSLVNVALIIIDRTNVPMTGICFFFGICAFYIHTDTHSHIYGHIYTHPNTIYIRNFHYRIVYPIERVSEEDKEDNDDLYSMRWQFILATHTKHIIIIIKPNKQLFDERIFCTFFFARIQIWIQFTNDFRRAQAFAIEGERCIDKASIILTLWHMISRYLCHFRCILSYLPFVISHKRTHLNTFSSLIICPVRGHIESTFNSSFVCAVRIQLFQLLQSPDLSNIACKLNDDAVRLCIRRTNRNAKSHL